MDSHSLGLPFDGDIPESSVTLLTEALDEYEADKNEAIKALIQERLVEIDRLNCLLNKAKLDLAALLKHDAPAILMLSDK